MSKFTQILYQVVFATKGRRPYLAKREHREIVYAYMAGVLRRHRCHVHIINGVADHVHLFFDLGTAHALGDVVKDLKLSAGILIRKELGIAGFRWNKGYFAGTYSQEAFTNVYNYIANQEEHHRKKTARQELKALLHEHGIEFEEAWLDE